MNLQAMQAIRRFLERRGRTNPPAHEITILLPIAGGQATAPAVFRSARKPKLQPCSYFPHRMCDCEHRGLCLDVA